MTEHPRPSNLTEHRVWRGLHTRSWSRFRMLGRDLLRHDRVRPAVCDNVKSWCQRHRGSSYEVILPPKEYLRKPPRTTESTTHHKFSKLMSRPVAIPEKYLACIADVRLVGAAGLVVLPDGSFAAESVDHPSRLAAEPTYYSPLPSATSRKHGRYYSLVLESALQDNYYHWIHDVILRLYRVRDRLPEDTRFVVPPRLREYQYDTLSVLGIHPENLDYFDGREPWLLKELYFSPATTSSGVDSPDADTWFRRLVLQAYGIEPQGRRRRIFVRRRLALHRRLVNESEVEAHLEQFGFEAYTLETMSFREQAALFSGAEIVVGSHGAGLTNIIFQEERIPVLDILESQEVNKCFWGMSEALGHQYWYLLGETVPNRGRNPDIRVSLPKLDTTLHRIGLRFPAVGVDGPSAHW